MQTMESPAAEYMQSVNQRDPSGFAACFANDAVVDDAGRRIDGIAAIRAWGEREIFAASVSLEVLAVTQQDGVTTVITKVDGTYDKTGLPDPLVMSHRVEAVDGRIARLTIGFAESTSK